MWNYKQHNALSRVLDSIVHVCEFLRRVSWEHAHIRKLPDDIRSTTKPATLRDLWRWSLDD